MNIIYSGVAPLLLHLAQLIPLETPLTRLGGELNLPFKFLNSIHTKPL
jgi:hypothetical protein